MSALSGWLARRKTDERQISFDVSLKGDWNSSDSAVIKNCHHELTYFEYVVFFLTLDKKCIQLVIDENSNLSTTLTALELFLVWEKFPQCLHNIDALSVT